MQMAVAPSTSAAIDGMVRIPAGAFLRGCSPNDRHCYDNERPESFIHLDAFYVDRMEVTVASYRRCVEAGACSDEALDSHAPTTHSDNAPGQGLNDSTSEPAVPDPGCNWPHPGRAEHPINCLSWHQATAFCAWRKKRLPSEAEWEKAARGRTENIYAWGNEPPSCERAVMHEGGAGCNAGSTAPVGSRAAGKSPYGVLDLTGNVWEWMADWYQDDFYAHSPDENPTGPAAGRFRVVKGGGWSDWVRGEIDSLRISNRYSYAPDLRFVYVGFRCMRDAD
jgi:formylglycine-generating enzyme required for sulfatase activity